MEKSRKRKVGEYGQRKEEMGPPESRKANLHVALFSEKPGEHPSGEGSCGRPVRPGRLIKLISNSRQRKPGQEEKKEKAERDRIGSLIIQSSRLEEISPDSE